MLSSTALLVALPAPPIAAAPATAAETPAPVNLVADLEPGPGSSNPDTLTTLGDTVYFGASTVGAGWALWGYRAPLANSPGQPVVLDPYGSPADIEPLGGLIYYEVGQESELRSYDPATGEVTVEVVDNGPLTPFGGIPNLAAMDGKLYYAATSPGEGYELWVFDPAADGGDGRASRIARNIAPGAADAAPTFMTALGGKLYFSAQSVGSGYELWVYDPVTNRAALAADIRPGGASADPRGLLALGGTLYFAAEDDRGEELWRYDPATTTASLVADIFPGAASSRPHDLTVLGADVYFGAIAPAIGDELWRLDPFTGAVELAADINPFPTGAFPGSDPRSLTALGGRLYFSASYRPYTIDGAGDLELWEYDPGANGGAGAASLVAEIRPGSERYVDSAEVSHLEVLDGVLYFQARGTTGGRELWSYTPSPLELAAAVLGGHEVEQRDTLVVNAFLRNRTVNPIDSELRWEITAPDGRRAVRRTGQGTTLGADGVLVTTLELPVRASATPGRYVATLSVLRPGGGRLSDTFSFTVLAGQA